MTVFVIIMFSLALSTAPSSVSTSRLLSAHLWIHLQNQMVPSLVDFPVEQVDFPLTCPDEKLNLRILISMGKRILILKLYTRGGTRTDQ